VRRISRRGEKKKRREKRREKGREKRKEEEKRRKEEKMRGRNLREKLGYKTPWASVRGVFLCEEVAASQCPAINGDVKYNEYVEDPLENDGGEYISIF
jgi:hypothetical protein